MENWIQELKTCQMEGVSQLNIENSNTLKKVKATASMSHFPSLSSNVAGRPQSVFPGRIRPADDITQQKPSMNVNKIENKLFPHRLESADANRTRVRQSVKDMRSLALQDDLTTSPVIENSYSSQEEEKHDYSNQNAVSQSNSSWGAHEDSKELQTARKRLAKAQNLNSKYENEIRTLRDKLATLTRENHDLTEKLNKRENTVDFDKQRRIEELEDVKEKLVTEKKLRNELNLQFEDVKNELKVLKESIHIVRTTPTIHHVASNPTTTVVHQIPAANTLHNQNSNSQLSANPPTPSPASSGVHVNSNVSLSKKRSISMSERPSMVSDPNLGLSRDCGAQNWLPDDDAIACLSCNTEFGLFTRKVCLFHPIIHFWAHFYFSASLPRLWDDLLWRLFC